MVKKSHNAQKIGKQAEKIKNSWPYPSSNTTASQAAFFASPLPIPIRNICNTATLLQGMARRVAPWQMWRITGRGRAAPRAGAGESGGPEGDRVAPPTGTQIAPMWGRQGGGMAPLLGRSPHATLAHSGGHRRGWSVRPGSRHGLSTDYFRK